MASKESIETRQTPVADVSLPLTISANFLAKHGPKRNETRDAALRRVIRLRLEDHPAIGDYLANHAHEARTWFLIDNLDGLRKPERISWAMATLARWQSQVIL